eukprot:Gb_17051 [translate_table: standard]
MKRVTTPPQLARIGEVWRFSLKQAFTTYKQSTRENVDLVIWVTKGVEDHLDHYAQEWEQFTISEGLIDHITGLPIHGAEIDLTEEIANEGSKWATRIMARRSIGVEANTYLSHQWPAITAKATEGTLYAWAPWLADRFKEHCIASQMFGHPFPMPSLLVVICMDALGPLKWTNLDDQPRLNSYSRLKRKRRCRASSETNPSIESSSDIVLPPSLQKLREKRKGHFLPTVQVLDDALTTQAVGKLISNTGQELTTKIEELELELILQAHKAQAEKDSLSHNVNLLLQEISKLGALPPIEHATKATEVLPNLHPHVHLLREKALAAKEAPLIPLEV